MATTDTMSMVLATEWPESHQEPKAEEAAGSQIPEAPLAPEPCDGSNTITG
jgi:hypothetical protein